MPSLGWSFAFGWTIIDELFDDFQRCWIAYASDRD
jgi:hypothetical protein